MIETIRIGDVVRLRGRRTDYSVVSIDGNGNVEIWDCCIGSRTVELLPAEAHRDLVLVASARKRVEGES